MMPTLLTSWLVFQNAAAQFGEVEIVSKEPGWLHRYWHRDFARALIERIDAVPRTSVGKLDKKALRARFAT